MHCRSDQIPSGGYLLLSDESLLEQCQVNNYRSGGPGGQKRNKTSSAVRLIHRPTGLIVTASEDRSQKVNRVHAIRRLREAIALNVRSAIDVPRGRLGDCLTPDGVFRAGPRDPGYYSAVQSVLDLFVASELSVSRTADALGMSTSHFVKLLHGDAKLWERANQMRAAAGLKPLRWTKK